MLPNNKKAIEAHGGAEASISFLASSLLVAEKTPEPAAPELVSRGGPPPTADTDFQLLLEAS
ncbi:hypothetical protein PG996_008956 [Apiospora saccharicola]|uniref:Uncharacterized protein n=1 Tax=Apiospora saccharicola TaxID=335842 RepID=A0ABR1UZD3_9PEZI